MSTFKLDPRALGNYQRARKSGVPAFHAYRSIKAAVELSRELEAFERVDIWTERAEATFTMDYEAGGVHLVYTVHRDLDAGRPEDNGDCYDAEDIAAWEQDHWHYYGVSVEATMGRFTHEESIWGIEGGSHWSKPENNYQGTEEQVMAVGMSYYFPPRQMIEAVQEVAIKACLEVAA